MIEKLFYVIRASKLSPRIYKTENTVKKYYKLHPDLIIKTFKSEIEAQNFFQSLLSSNEDLTKKKNRSLVIEKIPENLKKEKEKAEIDLNQEKNEEKLCEEFEKNEKGMNLFYFFRENEEKYEAAKKKILVSEKYHLFFDGASKGNPGPSGCGYLLFDNFATKIYQNSLSLGFKTNNQAEYFGLLYGMKSALNLGIKKLSCHGDSQLVIKQMLGEFQVKSFSLKNFHDATMNLKTSFQEIDFEHIIREKNDLADKLSKIGMTKFRKPFEKDGFHNE